MFLHLQSWIALNISFNLVIEWFEFQCVGFALKLHPLNNRLFIHGFEELYVFLGFDMMLRRAIQTNHSYFVIFSLNSHR